MNKKRLIQRKELAEEHFNQSSTVELIELCNSARYQELTFKETLRMLSFFKACLAVIGSKIIAREQKAIRGLAALEIKRRMTTFGK